MTATPAAPPSRWLLLLTIAVVALFTVLRFWLAATLDFRSDEAYYWTWSHQWVPSYLDHPPMVAWFERIGQAIFGDTLLGARFGQLISLPLIEFFLADIARRRTGSWNAALFVVLVLECTIYYGLVVVILEPSIPMLLFVSMLLWGLCRLDETMEARWWLLIGVAGGLALLSKLLVFLLAPALLVFILSRRHRGWLVTPWPWLAIAIAAALFSPVLIWNAAHGWPTFAFQSGRLDFGQGMGNRELYKFLLYDTLCAGLLAVPIMIVQSLRLAVGSVLRRAALEATIAVAFLFPLGFFLTRSLTMLINQSWAYFMWPIGILALALTFAWGGRWLGAKLVLALIVVPGFAFTGAYFYHGVADTSVWMERGDPYGQDAGFGEMADKVLAEAKANGAGWIATTEYRTYANLLWHIGKQIPVLQVNQRARFLDFAPVDPGQFVGKALYVHLGDAPPLLASAARTPLPPIPIVWRGTEMAQMHIDVLEGFAPDLNPAPDSPAYTWK